MVSILAALSRNGSVPLHLITGEDPHGRACWFFVLAPQRSAEAFVAQRDGIVDIHSVGRVVASGWGEIPDQATIDQMKNDYGWEQESDN